MRQDLLENHVELCVYQPVRERKWRMERVFFKNLHMSEPIPFTVYADFEAITVKVYTCQPPPHSQPKTEVLAEHQACGWDYTVISRYPSCPSVTKHYRGKDAVITFFKEMTELEETLFPYLKENKPMVLTAEEEA